VRGDIEELERVMDKIFDNIADAIREKAAGSAAGRVLTQDLAGLRTLSSDLVRKLEAIEARLTARAELARSAAG